jgi:hypothetical protein
LPPLFDDVQHTDASGRRYSEDSFAFLNRVSGTAWARIREVLEGWYAGFPDTNGDLRSRFRSHDPRQHYPAWWELYMHRLLRALGFEVTVHPNVPGTDGHPDFLAERGEDSFYVEARTVFSGIVAPNRREQLEAAIQDVINTIDASSFFVDLKYERIGTSMPSQQDIRQPIEAWLATLDPDTTPAFSDQAWEPITFGDWEISLRPNGRPPEHRERPDNRLIGMLTGLGGRVDDIPRIRSAIVRKGKSYGTPDKPLLVAALAMNGFVDDRAVMGALFGSEAVQVDVATGASRLTRSPDGVWVGKGGPAGKRVSAVLLGVGIWPSSIGTAWPRIWHHYAPTYKLTTELPFSTAQVVGEELALGDATRSAAEVLDVPNDWPGPLFPGFGQERDDLGS